MALLGLGVRQSSGNIYSGAESTDSNYKMLGVIGSSDRYLSTRLAELCTEAGLRTIRTSKLERIIKDLKQPGCLAIIDLNWEEVQKPGVLRQLVNLSRVSGNAVVCICPNQDEDLKKVARGSRAQKVFIRYDLQLEFVDFVEEWIITTLAYLRKNK